MKKYRCYYLNDFRDDYDAMSKQDDDGDWYRVEDVDARIAELEKALAPFAAMDRPGCDLKELACTRGTASDMTILTSEDFRRAAEALGL